MANKRENQVIEGSGNVFADLGFPDAERLQAKAELTRQIGRRIQKLKLTQAEAAERLGLKQPDVSKLVQGRYTGFSVDRLFKILNSLDVDVEIILRPRARKTKPKSISPAIHGSLRVMPNDV